MNLRIQGEQAWLVTGSLLVLTTIALAVVLWWTQAVMIPFVLSVFLVTIVSPIVDFQVNRWKVPRQLAIAGGLLVVLGILTVIGFFLYSSAQSIVSIMSDDDTGLVELRNRWVASAAEMGVGVDAKQLEKWIDEEVQRRGMQAAASVQSLIQYGVLVAIFVIFMITGRHPQSVRGIYVEIEATVRKYIGTKFLISAITGVLVYTMLTMVGLRDALMFGTLAFLLNFIPSIGSIVATMLPIPVAAAQFSDDPWRIVAAFALPGAVQITIGNFVEPKIMGHGLKLHPVVILICLAVWGIIWGPIGMLLAVPITATIRIVMLRFETTRTAAELLAGKLPLSEDESK